MSPFSCQTSEINNSKNYYNENKIFILVFLFVFTAVYSFSKDYKVSSPDGKIGVTVTAGH